MHQEDISKCVQFLVETDKLKNVERRNYNADGKRRENTAEHSWQIALMPILFAGCANEKVDILRVTQMLLIHDIVEIDAGDTYIYDEKGYEDKLERETRAAARIFGLLPDATGQYCLELWEEFEAGRTPEARFAVALDNLMPEINNYYSGGISWKENGVSYEKVHQWKQIIQEGSQSLWKLMEDILQKAREDGLLKA